MKTFLVIDDNEMVRDELSETISKELGAIVYTALSSAEGIECLKKEKVNFVICDLEMPDGSGVEVWHYLKREKLQLDFVLFTGRSPFDVSTLPVEIKVIHNKDFFQLFELLKIQVEWFSKR